MAVSLNPKRREIRSTEALSPRAAAVIVATIAASLAVLPAAAAPAQPRETLRAEVGPGFTIFLRHADGTAVTHLDPGEYAIVVEDKAIEHNFHLSGAGVNLFTSVENVETANWTVVFADGQTYRFQCDPHAATMNGSFGVGNVPQPPPPPVVRRLSASVSAAAISVKTSSGTKARVVAAGSYRIAVRDTAKTQNFHLTGPGVNRKTAVAGTSRATWNLRLRAGKYSYRSDRKRRLSGSFTVR
jgi:plastocyanin